MSLDKAKDVPSNDYFNSLADYTKDSEYTVATKTNWEKYSFDINFDSLSNKFTNNHSLTTSKNRLSYSFELNTQIKLISLDYLIAWSLDSCWLSDNPCAANITSDLMDVRNFYEYYYDNSEYDIDEYDNDYGKLDEELPIRKARNIEPSTRLIHSTKTNFKFNSHKKHYEIYLNITLNGFNVKNLKNRKYFFCYLKPCSVCDCTELSTKCDSNLRVSKYFLTKPDTSKLKTIIIGHFNTTDNDTSLLVPNVNIDSNDLKQEFNCTNLNFPSKLNKETIKVESSNAPVTSTSASTTLKSTVYNSSSIKTFETNTHNWIDHNKLTTILILLITIIVILMVCVALRTFLPRNFFRKCFLIYFQFISATLLRALKILMFYLCFLRRNILRLNIYNSV